MILRNARLLDILQVAKKFKLLQLLGMTQTIPSLQPTKKLMQ